MDEKRDTFSVFVVQYIDDHPSAFCGLIVFKRGVSNMSSVSNLLLRVLECY